MIDVNVMFAPMPASEALGLTDEGFNLGGVGSRSNLYTNSCGPTIKLYHSHGSCNVWPWDAAATCWKLRICL